MVDLYPGGIAINTAPKSPHAASGYEEIKGEKRLVLYTTPNPDLQTDDNYTYYWSCIKNKYMIVKYKD